MYFSPIMFLIVMGDVMNKVILGKNTGINWWASQQLEDLDFADIIYHMHSIRFI
jgi:hypothetical protein